MGSVAGGKPRVLIAGAGFGGIATAVALRRELSPDQLEIVLIDRRDDFVMGFRKSWAVLGIDTLRHGLRELSAIDGVTLQRGEITGIEPTRRAIEVGGQRIQGDALVLALGAEHAPLSVPGLAEHGVDVWHRGEAERARDAVRALTHGRLLIGIFGMPYSCPPAPYELALLARERLPPTVDVKVFTPAPFALPVVGREESAKVELMLGRAGIGFEPGLNAVRVTAGTVEFADEMELRFDLLLAVPPHRCPHVLTEAGLARPAGWLMPDPRTLEMPHEGVYAIGDCIAIPLANGMALPKAGIFAHAQGEVVAARIAARLRGVSPSATFAGEGTCFIETGGGQAAKATGSFMADPPQVRISESSEVTMAEKLDFERSRLEAWFGG